MRYPLDIHPDGKFFLVTFPDIPEALTQGKTMDEARKAATAALEAALDFYFEDSRPVPEPSPLRPGQESIELPAALSAKLLLRNETFRRHLRPAELARQQATRD